MERRVSFLVFCLFLLTSAKTQSVCMRRGECRIPECRCSDSGTPGGLDEENVPQMVIFTFDSSVNTLVYRYYERLFSSDRRNPNGCPVKMTVFVPHKNTNYKMVRSLAKRGMEIGAQGISPAAPRTYWRDISFETMRREIREQLSNLEKKAEIPKSEIHGWRNPGLQPSGELQYDLLTNFTFEYDSSLSITKRGLDEFNTWPFTLDHGWERQCHVKPCPLGKYPGLWEVPVVSLVDPVLNGPCGGSHVDSCIPSCKQAAVNLLWKNFLSHYQRDKAPFLLNMQAMWFLRDEEFLEAVDEFMQALLTYDDVYFVTVHQALQWIKNPLPKDRLAEFAPWQCSSPVPRNTSLPRFVAPSIVEPPCDSPIIPPLPLMDLPPCQQNRNCMEPHCRCSKTGPPSNISSSDIPQMVIITYDGTVSGTSTRLYRQLFNNERKNPNGCPISMTIFVHDRETEYNHVLDWYLKGMEIGVHSVSVKSPSSYWATLSEKEMYWEIVGQRKIISNKTRIPESQIRGWRSPFLQPSGDRQFKVLYENDFDYDSTLTMTKRSLTFRNRWPFTLDYGWDVNCEIPPCPVMNYTGLWQVPIVSMVNGSSSKPCRGPYVDSCLTYGREEAYNLLMENFNSHYNYSRAPFMLNLQMSWLMQTHNYDAMKDFFTTLLKKGDVYILSIQKALAWMKNPISLSNIKSFTPWQCTSEIPLLTTTTTTTTTTPRPKSTTTTATTQRTTRTTSRSSTPTTRPTRGRETITATRLSTASRPPTTRTRPKITTSRSTTTTLRPTTTTSRPRTTMTMSRTTIRPTRTTTSLTTTASKPTTTTTRSSTTTTTPKSATTTTRPITTKRTTITTTTTLPRPTTITTSPITRPRRPVTLRATSRRPTLTRATQTTSNPTRKETADRAVQTTVVVPPVTTTPSLTYSTRWKVTTEVAGLVSDLPTTDHQYFPGTSYQRTSYPAEIQSKTTVRSQAVHVNISISSAAKIPKPTSRGDPAINKHYESTLEPQHLPATTDSSSKPQSQHPDNITSENQQFQPTPHTYKVDVTQGYSLPPTVSRIQDQSQVSTVSLARTTKFTYPEGSERYEPDSTTIYPTQSNLGLQGDRKTNKSRIPVYHNLTNQSENNKSYKSEPPTVTETVDWRSENHIRGENFITNTDQLPSKIYGSNENVQPGPANSDSSGLTSATPSSGSLNQGESSRSTSATQSYGSLNQGESSRSTSATQSYGSLNQGESSRSTSATQSPGSLNQGESSPLTSAIQSPGSLNQGESSGSTSATQSYGSLNQGESSGSTSATQSPGSLNQGESSGSTSETQSPGSLNQEESSGSTSATQSSVSLNQGESSRSTSATQSPGSLNQGESSGSTRATQSPGSLNQEESSGSTSATQSSVSLNQGESSGSTRATQSPGSLNQGESSGSTSATQSYGSLNQGESSGSTSATQSPDSLNPGESSRSTSATESFVSINSAESSKSTHKIGTYVSTNQTDSSGSVPTSRTEISETTSETSVSMNPAESPGPTISADSSVSITPSKLSGTTNESSVSMNPMESSGPLSGPLTGTDSTVNPAELFGPASASVSTELSGGSDSDASSGRGQENESVGSTSPAESSGRLLGREEPVLLEQPSFEVRGSTESGSDSLQFQRLFWTTLLLAFSPILCII